MLGSPAEIRAELTQCDPNIAIQHFTVEMCDKLGSHMVKMYVFEIAEHLGSEWHLLVCRQVGLFSPIHGEQLRYRTSREDISQLQKQPDHK